MKNIMLIILLLTTTFAYAQDKKTFEGVWESEDINVYEFKDDVVYFCYYLKKLNTFFLYKGTFTYTDKHITFHYTESGVHLNGTFYMSPHNDTVTYLYYLDKDTFNISQFGINHEQHDPEKLEVFRKQ